MRSDSVWGGGFSAREAREIAEKNGIFAKIKEAANAGKFSVEVDKREFPLDGRLAERLTVSGFKVDDLPPDKKRVCW